MSRTPTRSPARAGDGIGSGWRSADSPPSSRDDARRVLLSTGMPARCSPSHLFYVGSTDVAERDRAEHRDVRRRSSLRRWWSGSPRPARCRSAAAVVPASIFFWRPPHFWALALFRSADYARVQIRICRWSPVPKRRCCRSCFIPSCWSRSAGRALPLAISRQLGVTLAGARRRHARLARCRLSAAASGRIAARHPQMFAFSILYLSRCCLRRVARSHRAGIAPQASGRERMAGLPDDPRCQMNVPPSAEAQSSPALDRDRSSRSASSCAVFRLPPRPRGRPVLTVPSEPGSIDGHRACAPPRKPRCGRARPRRRLCRYLRAGRGADVGASTAAVPFYTGFGRATGFNGTHSGPRPRASSGAAGRNHRVRCLSQFRGRLPWKFRAGTEPIDV